MIVSKLSLCSIFPLNVSCSKVLARIGPACALKTVDYNHLQWLETCYIAKNVFLYVYP